MQKARGVIDHRTEQQIREHYEVERELSDRLRRAPREARRELYSTLYDELFRRVPLHPQRVNKLTPDETLRTVRSEVAFIKRFLHTDCTFLEIGPGDCSLSFEVAKFTRQTYGIDVSAEITKASATPDNFRLILSDGCSIPVPEGSIDIAYSNNLMEHLHPDDAADQLHNILKALGPGGIYICVTPNRLNGPHDVSQFFDTEATGFHLKEYTVAELIGLFKSVGFANVKTYVGGRGIYLRLPVGLPLAFEWLWMRLPAWMTKPASRRLPVTTLLNCRILGLKAPVRQRR